MRQWSVFLVLALGAASYGQTVEASQLAAVFRIREQAERDEALALALAYGLPLRQEFPDGRIIELARFMNGRPLYRITDNVNAALTTRANQVHPGGAAGLSLTGAGVIIGEWDGGAARPTHQEFGGRVTVVDGASNSNHATHVAGTMIASGVSANAKGMAWGATLRSHDWNSDNSEMATAASSHNVVISNHSYGMISGWYQNGTTWYWYGDRVAGHTEDAGFGFYDSGAQAWDQIAWNNPYFTIFKSAGNDRGDGPSSQPITHKEWSGSAWIDVTTVREKDGGTLGYDTISYSGNAKNIITVGAVNDVLSYTGPASVTMTSFSGWGPTDDGRIKPDLVANGASLYSSSSASDTAYTTMSGTSMSSPNAAGSAALVVQHCKNIYGGFPPRSNLLKGLLIHTADECGPNPGPDYMFGWGLMNVRKACELLTQETAPGPLQYSRTRPEESKASGVVLDRKYTHTGGPIKVTICWTDEPATPPAWAQDPPTPMLKRDLDLRLIHVSSGTIYSPWVLNPASPAAAATTGDNNRDNVEQVYIASPPAGQYIVRVTNKGTYTGTTIYSLFTDSLQYVDGQLSSISISPTYVEGGNPATLTVNLDGPSYFGSTVSLSDNGTAITTPASVTVPIGAYSATTTLNTLPVSSFWTGTVTATYGTVVRTATLQVMPPFGLQSIAVDKSIVIAGETPLTSTVITKAYAPSDTSIAITDSSVNLVTPSSIVMAAGTRVKTFNPTSTPVSTVTPATISATLLGVTKTASLTLSPPPVLVGMTISPTVCTGGNPISGTVTLSLAAPTGGAVVTLADNTMTINTPASTTVPGGATVGTFTCTTIPVTTRFRRQITATYRGVTLSRDIVMQP